MKSDTPLLLTPETKKVIGAGILGNSLELYDFSLYGYFATTIALLYFPSHDPISSLLATYGVFAAGFLMRPMGALFFGYIGDCYGRKKALELSILLMAIPTVLMGILPTYASIGIFAPILLVILRLFQGVSVGGELVGSYTFLVEHAPSDRKAFVGSWALVGNFGGKILGASSVIVMGLILPSNQLEEWGWRIPFLFGIVFATTGYFLRKQVSETPVFKELKANKKIKKTPLWEAIRSYKKPILQAIGCTMVHTVALYMLFVYLPVYLTTVLNIPYQTAIGSNLLAMLITTIVIPLSALLSDHIGRKPFLLYGAITLASVSYPAFQLLSQGSIPIIFATHATLALIFGITHGPLSVIYVELFDAHVRYTTSAIAYNITVGLFGGMTPLICTWLISVTGISIAPTFWLMLSGIISATTVATMKETRVVYA